MAARPQQASGSAITPQVLCLNTGALPIGLAHRVKLTNDVAHSAVVRWPDVETDAADDAVVFRRAMEAKFAR